MLKFTVKFWIAEALRFCYDKEKLSKELLEGYEAYVQENGYPDPAKMGEYFMDYLGTDSAKQELSAGL